MIARVLAAIGLAAGVAHADDKAAADAAFAEAKQLVAKGELAQACPKFELSYREDPQLGSLLNLADCHEKIGKLATARAEFRSAVEIARQHKDARGTFAASRAAALDARVSTVVVRKRPEAGAITVQLDGRDVTAMIDSELPIDNGHHDLVTTVTGVGTWKRALDIGTDASRLELVVPESRPPDVPVAVDVPVATMPVVATAPVVVAAPAPRTRPYVLAGSLAAGGVIAIGVGLYFGHVASADWDDSKCKTGCSPTGKHDVDSAYTAATTSDVLVGVGVAAIAAAAIVWFTGGHEGRVAPVAGPGTAGAGVAIAF